MMRTSKSIRGYPLKPQSDIKGWIIIILYKVSNFYINIKLYIKLIIHSSEKQLEARASARVEPCPRDAEPWYWKEGDDGAYIVIVNGVSAVIELLRRFRK